MTRAEPLTLTRDTEMGRFHWGAAPIPRHAELVGTVQRQPGSPWIWGAALLRFEATGLYAEGSQGAIRTLSQHEVVRALEAL